MISRRHFLISAGAAGLLPSTMARAAISSGGNIATLLQRAKMAMERHDSLIVARDRIGLVDFSMASRQPRFHLVDLEGGAITSMLVAHGRGSDPDHSGWLKSFSNLPGSAASSAGAYLTGDFYAGKHGRSRRLIGLDPGNSNAEARAIVIHGAWYVSAEMARDKGKIGRSEGCLAVGEGDVEKLLDRLGPGRLIYADKL